MTTLFKVFFPQITHLDSPQKMDSYNTLDDSGVFNDDGTSGGDADGVNMVFSGKRGKRLLKSNEHHLPFHLMKFLGIN